MHPYLLVHIKKKHPCSKKKLYLKLLSFVYNYKNLEASRLDLDIFLHEVFFGLNFSVAALIGRKHKKKSLLLSHHYESFLTSFTFSHLPQIKTGYFRSCLYSLIIIDIFSSSLLSVSAKCWIIGIGVQSSVSSHRCLLIIRYNLT